MFQRVSNLYKDLKRENLFSEVWALAFPSILTTLSINIFGLIDLFFIGKLNNESIAAVSIGGFFVSIIFTAVIAMSTGTLATTSRLKGANNDDELSHLAGQTVILGLFLGLLVTSLFYFLIPTIITLIGAKGKVHALAVTYSRIVILGAPAYLGHISVNAIYKGCGDAKTPLKIVATSMFINIILDPILIFGLFGFPRLEVAGSAIATVMARITGLIIGYSKLFSKKSPAKPIFRNIDFKLMWNLLKIGIGGSVQMLTRNMVNLILIHIATFFGTVAIAAYGIVIRIQFLIIMAGNGNAISAATLIGQRLGSGNKKGADKPAWAALMIYEAILSVIMIIFFIFSKEIMLLFTSSIPVVTMGGTFLKFFALIYPIWAFALILGRSMMGSGDTYTPMKITIINLVFLRLPLAFYLSSIKFLAVYGLFLAIVLTNITHALLAYYYFKLGKWKDYKIN